jgi:hypothetical protein
MFRQFVFSDRCTSPLNNAENNYRVIVQTQDFSFDITLNYDLFQKLKMMKMMNLIF